LVVVVSATFSFVSFSASAGASWISLASSDDGTKWEAKPGSFEFSKNRNDAAIAVLAGRVVSSKPYEVSLHKWYVTGTDCKNKMGKLITLSVGGDYQYENDFIFDSGNVASAIAEFICTVADQSIKNANAKSL
jgi:hypothetical protein